jgi:hypothetical protein
MLDNVKNFLSSRLRGAALTMVAGAIMTATTVHADPFNSVVLVPPADLPVLARQNGEAMLLHETIDGRTLLYVEQQQGARLAVFDVTDPVHIKGENSVQLNASGPFDFVSPLGDQAELVRLRQSHEDAVLSFPRAKAPSLKMVQASALQDPVSRPVDNALSVTKADTGTTFMLRENGLYVIRRPAQESIHQLMAISPN